MWSSSSSPGSTRFTTPSRSASSERKTRPERSRSSAWAGPIRRGSSHELPCSATSPRRANAVVNLTPAAAKRRSHISACTSPIPAHAPLIAATIGLRIVSGNVCGRGGAAASAPLPPPSPALSAASASMSKPGQNPRPAPVTTTTRVSGSRSASARRSK